MNGLSDSLTIGLVLSLIFGALFFYLYTRISQVEKRVSLTENILLDLKMATENTLMTLSAPPSMEHAHMIQHEKEEADILPQQASQAELSPSDIEEIPDDDYYKNVLEQASSTTQKETHITPVKMEVNYESMTLKELKSLAKQRGLNMSQSTHKKDIIEALKKQNVVQTSVLEPVPGSSMELEEGFPVELGSN